VKKIRFVSLVLALALLACNLPSLNVHPSATPEPQAEVLLPGWQYYDGRGMRLYLPSDFAARDINADLPRMVEIIKAVLGEDSTVYKMIAENLIDKIVWWGVNESEAFETADKVLVYRNPGLNSIPVSTLAGALTLVGGEETNKLESENLILGERKVSRFVSSSGERAMVAYVFKEEGALWMLLFLTTPEKLANNLGNFDKSMLYFVIDSAIQ
jgi:hypothetical protein